MIKPVIDRSRRGDLFCGSGHKDVAGTLMSSSERGMKRAESDEAR